MENLNFKIVFKFRDDLLIKHDSNLGKKLGLKSEYTKAVETFFKNTGRTPLTISNNNSQSDFGIESKVNLLVSFMTDLESKWTERKTNYLFRLNDYEVFNTLYQERIKPNQSDEYYFPNFYNYFYTTILFKKKSNLQEFLEVLKIPHEEFNLLSFADREQIEKDFLSQEDTFIKDVQIDFFNFFEILLPHKNHFNQHLLEVCYIKSESTPPVGLDNYSDEYEYDDFLKLIGYNSNERLGDAVVTVMDYSFNTDKSKIDFFKDKEVIGDFSLLCPPKLNKKLIEKKIKLNTFESTTGHGTASVSVIKNLFSKCKIKLISTEGANEGGKTIDEDNALLTAIHNSLEGEIILIELESANHSPLEIQPVIFQLIQLATYLGIIIVEPSGNSCEDLSMITYADVKEILGNSAKIKAESSDCYWIHYQKFYADNAAYFKKNSLKQLENQNSFIKLFINSNTPSGAILVGGLVSSLDEPLTMYDKSKNRIKLYSIGDGIQAVKIENDKWAFEPHYSHSSGASAFMAGIIALMQARVKEKLGKPLLPEDMLSLLSDEKHSVEIDVEKTYHIPSLKKIIEVIDLIAEIKEYQKDPNKYKNDLMKKLEDEKQNATKNKILREKLLGVQPNEENSDSINILSKILKLDTGVPKHLSFLEKYL